MNTPILVITGPTASGKSAIAHGIGDEIPATIISADSRQVIRGFDIGSGKPSALDRSRYDYRIIDQVEPGERYSAFKFKEAAEKEIIQARLSGRVPIIVGGTGLYIRALTTGIFEIGDPTPDIVSRIDDEYARLGAVGMHEILQRVDPIEAVVTHPNNEMRVRRALEIFYLTGKSRTELSHNASLASVNYQFKIFALTPPIADVYAQIERRIDEMFTHGWQDEVAALCQRHGIEAIRRARAIGYSEILDHQAGKLPLGDAVALIKQNTRRYAKRQMTWIRGSSVVEQVNEKATLLTMAKEIATHGAFGLK